VGNRAGIDLATGTWQDIGFDPNVGIGEVVVTLLWLTGEDPTAAANACGNATPTASPNTTDPAASFTPEADPATTTPDPAAAAPPPAAEPPPADEAVAPAPDTSAEEEDRSRDNAERAAKREAKKAERIRDRFGR
jgi:hypothetical protein